MFVLELFESVFLVCLYVDFRCLRVFWFFEIFLLYLCLNFWIKWFIILWLKFFLFKCVLLVVDKILNIDFLFICRIEILKVFLLRLKINIFFLLLMFLFSLYVSVVVVGLLMICKIFKFVIILVFLVVFFWELLK